MSEIQTILHPTDFSASSDEAFRWAESLAAHLNAKLIVLHVSQTYPASGGPVPETFLSKSAQAGMEGIRLKRPAVELEKLVLAGPTAEVILDIALQRACDLIVVGTHGRTGLAHALLGSVAEKLVREAPCPVVTVKAPTARRRVVQPEAARHVTV